MKSLEEHLLRHTSDESFVGEAVQAAQASFDPRTGSELLWLHLDWSKVFPELTVRAMSRDAVTAPASGFAPVSATERPALSDATTGDPRTTNLTVPREVVMNFDPDVAVLVDLD
ncbi:MAG TPA: hypothetical protein VGD51_02200, partial [Nocardioidaceae bacterium]